MFSEGTSVCEEHKNRRGDIEKHRRANLGCDKEFWEIVGMKVRLNPGFLKARHEMGKLIIPKFIGLTSGRRDDSMQHCQKVSLSILRSFRRNFGNCNIGEITTDLIVESGRNLVGVLLVAFGCK